MTGMKAMVLRAFTDLSRNENPLVLEDLPAPEPAEGEIRIRVRACGVCRTELDEIEGRLPPPRLPVILGHQAVGVVESLGRKSKQFREGDRVGVGWIFSACGTCGFCKSGRENLCPGFKATGKDAAGGYAEFMTVGEDFAHPIPKAFADAQAAPLLCAGAIGRRSLRLSGLKDGQILGLSGFGASAHLTLKLVGRLFPRTDVFVFTRSEGERAFARELGAAWTGDFSAEPPDRMDAVIDTTPVWKPVVESLRRLRPGGRLVVNAIRKENADKNELSNIDYETHLWMEREIKSVANVTRGDISEFLQIAGEIPILPEVETYPLEEANRALAELKRGIIRGAKVLRIG
jgi:propanol-preferring alcohol dehydrogenase